MRRLHAESETLSRASRALVDESHAAVERSLEVRAQSRALRVSRQLASLESEALRQELEQHRDRHHLRP